MNEPELFWTETAAATPELEKFLESLPCPPPTELVVEVDPDAGIKSIDLSVPRNEWPTP